MSLYTHSPVTQPEAEEYAGAPSIAAHVDILNAALDLVESHTDRRLFQRAEDLTEYYDGEGRGHTVLYPDQWPIQSVTSLHADANRLWTADSLLSADYYAVNRDRTAIELVPYGAGSGNAAAFFGRGRQNLKLVYSPGYPAETCPADLKLAVKMIFAAMLEDSGIGTAGKKMLRKTTIARAGESVTVVDDSGIPEAAKTILARYVRQTGVVG